MGTNFQILSMNSPVFMEQFYFVDKSDFCCNNNFGVFRLSKCIFELVNFLFPKTNPQIPQSQTKLKWPSLKFSAHSIDQNGSSKKFP